MKAYFYRLIVSVLKEYLINNFQMNIDRISFQMECINHFPH
jgi:5'-3' exonuclease